MQNPETLFFYDLETSGVNPRSARIMQFGGVRTDLDFNLIGEPYNFLIKLPADVLPEPDAILVTGITPQQTLADGISEAEFAQIFDKEINKPNTTFLGFNSIRFDDEFMRFFLYRNFRDPYEWQWKDGRSRWDMLDVSRMARALRPEGTKWPFSPDGKPSNRLELLASANKFDHDNAHDALSDVYATVALAKHLRSKQPKLFNYLYEKRGKQAVKHLVNSEDYFVYSSGKYLGEFEKTTMVANLGPHPDKQGSLVYDLRHDPREYLKLNPEELAQRWQYDPEATDPRLPVKALQYNRCPAIAPKGVVTESAAENIKIDLADIEKNYQLLQKDKDFLPRLQQALEIMNSKRDQPSLIVDDLSVDRALYEKFIPDHDKSLLTKFLREKPENMASFARQFSDERLKALAPLYIARNFPEVLSEKDHVAWQQHCQRAITAGGEKSMAKKFENRLQALAQQPGLTKEKAYLLEEINLYAQSVVSGVDV